MSWFIALATPLLIATALFAIVLALQGVWRLTRTNAGSCSAEQWKSLRTLDTVWSIFCVSIAFAMLQRGLAESLGSYRFLLGIGGAATCNMFWLVARALFRPNPSVEKPQICFVALIALLVISNNLLNFWHAVGNHSEAGFRFIQACVHALLALLGPGIMVLTAYEALREFAQHPRCEQVVRLKFVGVFGTCVLLVTVLPPVWKESVYAGQLELLLIAACAFSSLSMGTHLVKLHHIPADRQIAPSCEPEMVAVGEAPIAPNAEAMDLAARIESKLLEAKLYLDPELKVARFADALGVHEYKVSRVLSGILKQKNFNQYINHFRVPCAGHAARSRTQTGANFGHCTGLWIRLFGAFQSRL